MFTYYGGGKFLVPIAANTDKSASGDADIVADVIGRQRGPAAVTLLCTRTYRSLVRRNKIAGLEPNVLLSHACETAVKTRVFPRATKNECFADLGNTNECNVIRGRVCII